MYHFGLKIGTSDDELRDALNVLRENQVNVVDATDHGMTHSLYITDPHGNEIELYVDVPGVDWEDPALWANPVLRPLRL
jgi:catechol-2,3-dioxygenase